MKTNSRQKLFLTIAFSLIIVSFFGLVLRWLFSQVKKASASLGETASRVARLEAERKTAREIQALLKDRAVDLAKVNKFFVDRGEPVEFIENLEAIAKKTQNRIAIDFDEGQSRGKNLFFRLTIEGSEANIRKYFKLLELMPYKIKIEDMIFQKIGSGAASFSSRLIVLIQVETL